MAAPTCCDGREMFRVALELTNKDHKGQGVDI